MKNENYLEEYILDLKFQYRHGGLDWYIFKLLKEYNERNKEELNWMGNNARITYSRGDGLCLTQDYDNRPEILIPRWER